MAPILTDEERHIVHDACGAVLIGCQCRIVQSSLKTWHGARLKVPKCKVCGLNVQLLGIGLVDCEVPAEDYWFDAAPWLEVIVRLHARHGTLTVTIRSDPSHERIRGVFGYIVPQFGVKMDRECAVEAGMELAKGYRFT